VDKLEQHDRLTGGTPAKIGSTRGGNENDGVAVVGEKHSICPA
jgi:hypothetical protein